MPVKRLSCLLQNRDLELGQLSLEDVAPEKSEGVLGQSCPQMSHQALT